MQISCNHGQSSFKALLHNYGKWHLVQWGHQPSEGSSPVEATLSATSGKTQSTRTYHKSTHTCWRASTSHWETTATSCDIVAVLTLKAHGWTHIYISAAIHYHLVHHTMTDEPHHIFTPRYLHIWWVGQHQVRRLAQQYWNSSRYLEEELCMPGWGQILWPSPHLFTRHFKLGSAGITLVIYFIWNSVMQTYTPTHHVLWKSYRGKMRHWQPLCTISKQKLRGVTSTATLPPYSFLSRVSRIHTILLKKCKKRTPRPYQRLSNWWRSSTWHNRLQLHCHPLWWRWCQMMTDVLFEARQVILVTTAPMQSLITVTASVILSRTAQRKFSHQEHLITMTDHAPTHTGTDDNLSITDVATENVLTGQSHTTNLNVAEAPATAGGTHPTTYPTNAAAHDTHPLTAALSYTLSRTPHSSAEQPSTTPHSSCQSHSHDCSKDQSQSSSRHSYNTNHKLYTWKASKLYS